MRLFVKCASCNHFRFFTRQWWYTHFSAGEIHDKEENPKCFWCYRQLQQAIDRMKP